MIKSSQKPSKSLNLLTHIQRLNQAYNMQHNMWSINHLIRIWRLNEACKSFTCTIHYFPNIHMYYALLSKTITCTTHYFQKQSYVLCITLTSLRKTNFQPLRWARTAISMSSTVVRSSHPPESSSAFILHTPAVPLKPKKFNIAPFTCCSTSKW